MWCLGDVPWLDLVVVVRGRGGGELLEALSRAGLGRQQAGALRLTAADLADEADLPLVLDRCLGSTDLAVRGAAAGFDKKRRRNYPAMIQWRAAICRHRI